jgi:hypothetical protein
MRLRRTALLLVSSAVIAAAGCSNPASSITFAPPAGWSASPSVFGFQVWQSPDKRQALMLFRLSAHMDANRALQRSSFTSFDVRSRKTIHICGHQPATFVDGTGTSDSHDRYVEMIVTSYRDASYLALYARDTRDRPNAAAERAIRELCPKR